MNNSDKNVDNHNKNENDDEDKKPYFCARKDEYENIIISFGSVQSKENALEAFKDLSIDQNEYVFDRNDVRMPMNKI